MVIALVNKDNNKGVAIEFNTKQLPVLTLWKNTDTFMVLNLKRAMHIL